MTRKTIYRITVAMKMLLSGNFAAYWWILPRRMKKIRTHRDVMTYLLICRESERVVAAMRHQMDMFRLFSTPGMHVAPISERDFRIPFRRVSG